MKIYVESYFFSPFTSTNDDDLPFKYEKFCFHLFISDKSSDGNKRNTENAQLLSIKFLYAPFLFLL